MNNKEKEYNELLSFIQVDVGSFLDCIIMMTKDNPIRDQAIDLATTIKERKYDKKFNKMLDILER